MSTIKLVTTKTRAYWNDYAEPADVLEYFKDHTHIGFDTETSGMSFMNSVLHSIQFGDYEQQFVIDLDGIDIHLFAPLFKKTLVLHNAAFDLPFLYNVGYVPEIFDTLLAEKNLSLGLLLDRDLGAVVQRYCGATLDKAMQSEIAKGLISFDAVEYAGLDVKYLLKVMEMQIEHAKVEQVINAILLDCRFARVAAYMEYCGMYIDEDTLTKFVRKHEAYEYLAEENLCKYVEENHPELYSEDFNWGSPIQVSDFFSKIGVNCYDKKTKKPTINAKELAKHKDNPMVAVYLDYATKKKAVSTYGRNWFEYVWEDGRVHSKFNIIVDTGRTSCGNIKMGPFPNLQNFPREGGMRSIFKSKGPNVLIACDYSGQESVVLAEMSLEPKLLEFYRSGSGDLHSYVAKLLFPEELKDIDEKDVAKLRPDLRQLSKSANFAIAYGGTGYTISENLGVPRDVGDRVYEAYITAFPGLAKFFDANLEDTLNRGFIRINYVTGRKRKVDREYLRDPRMRSALNRLSTNTKIQGTSADISKTASVLFFEWLLANKMFGKVLIVNFVHDEIVIECHKARSEAIAAVLQEKMELAGTYYMNLLKLKAEPKIGKQWPK